MVKKVSITALACCLSLIVFAAIGQVTTLPTSETALVGRFARGPVDLPVGVGAAEFDAIFGSANVAAWPAEVQARQYFANGGSVLHIVRIAGTGSLANALIGGASDLSGIHALEPRSDLRLLIAPELSLLSAGDFANVFASLRAFLEPRHIFFILDPPAGLASAGDMVSWVNAAVPADASFYAVYFPYLQIMLDGAPLTVPASGAMAAIYAKNDAASGMWRSPSGTSLPLQAQGLSLLLNSSSSDLLNGNHINPIRQFNGIGIVPWSARTLDRADPDNLYISVVRTRTWIAASIQRSLAFAATQDNGEPLWAQISVMADGFLHSLFLQGASAGRTPAEAYFVRCDSSTTTAADIAAHRANVLYGFAMLRAAEFDLTLLNVATYDSQQPTPLPRIRARSLAGNLLSMYPTVAGFAYELESKTNLTSGIWVNAAATVSGDGAWRSPAILMTGDRGFYRLRITPIR